MVPFFWELQSRRGDSHLNRHIQYNVMQAIMEEMYKVYH